MTQKKKNRLNLTASISIAVAIVLLFGLSLNWVVSSLKMRYVMQSAVGNQLKERLTMQQDIIDSYIMESEDYLIRFSTSPTVKQALQSGDTKELQQYIKDYVATAQNVENVYVADMNSTVVASFVEPVIGKTLREGDALKQLQDALANGMYNTGIMASKATGQQIISMYYPVYDGSKMIGYVGAAVYSHNLQDSFDALGQKVMLIDATSKAYIFHENPEQIGTLVEDDDLLNIISKATDAQAPVEEVVVINGQEMISLSQMIVGRNWILVAYTPHSEAFSGIRTLSRMMLTTNLGTFVLVFIVLLISTKLALKDIVQIIDICKTLESLDLKRRKELDVYTECKNEAGMIGNALNSLAESVASVVTKVKHNSATLQESVRTVEDRISNTNALTTGVMEDMQEIAQGASDQAADTQTANKKVIEIGELIEQTSNNLLILKSNAVEMDTASDNAENTLKELSTMSEKTRGIVDLINQRMDSACVATNAIKTATDMITDIAEETNLLALNASIEAACAGEAGKGFAVVAEQIKKLSEQSNESAEQIQNTITKLVKEVSDSVKTMKTVSDIIDEQNKCIYDAETSFDIVKSRIDHSTSQIDKIMSDTKQLDNSRRTVIDLVSNLSAIAHENANTSEKSANSATTLGEEISLIWDEVKSFAKIADELEDNISKFML